MLSLSTSTVPISSFNFLITDRIKTGTDRVFFSSFEAKAVRPDWPEIQHEIRSTPPLRSISATRIRPECSKVKVKRRRSVKANSNMEDFSKSWMACGRMQLSTTALKRLCSRSTFKIQ